MTRPDVDIAAAVELALAKAPAIVAKLGQALPDSDIVALARAVQFLADERATVEQLVGELRSLVVQSTRFSRAEVVRILDRLLATIVRPS